MKLYCGIDWAQAHHDVAIVDEDGRVVARTRVSNDAAGFTRMLQVLADAGDTPKNPIPVAIDTDRGLWVASLRATGRTIYAINPLAASRYRSRHQVSGAKSDATDAVLLANILRTDAAAHRPLPADTEGAQAIRVLARAQQDAVWSRQQIGNQVRDLLKEFYPAALAAFAELPEGGLARRDARAILAAAPTPAQAARLSCTQLRSLLTKAGRRRYLDRDIEKLREVFRGDYLHQPPQVEAATGIQLGALLRQFDAACSAADELAEAATAHFERHPDAEIITSFPGLGKLAGARVLAEIGDDRTRFADARGPRPTPDPRPSPAPAAGRSSCCTATSRTTVSTPSARSGHWHRCAPRPAHAATSTPAAPPETGTTKPNGTCSTNSSASSTTASKPARPTTNIRHFHLLPPSRLDF